MTAQKDAKLKRAVAKLRGWTKLSMRRNFYLDKPEILVGLPPKDYKIVTDGVPDYPQDLNAIHEAVEHLTVDQKCRWQHELWTEVRTWDRDMPTKMDDVHFAQASATQRCNAYIEAVETTE